MGSKAIVESPSTSGPLQSFESIEVPTSPPKPDPEHRIWLRPEDTVVFTEPPCRVVISVRRTDERQSPNEGLSTDVQVKSSAAAGQPTSETVVGDGVAGDSETEDDEVDGDGEHETSGFGSHRTPGTVVDVPASAFQDGEGTNAVQDTPVRPGSNADNGVFSTAPVRQQSQHEAHKKAGSNRATPALASPSAGIADSKGLKANQQISKNNIATENDSQDLFKGMEKKKRTTYGRISRGSRPGTPASKFQEVVETPQQGSGQGKSKGLIDKCSQKQPPSGADMPASGTDKEVNGSELPTTGSVSPLNSEDERSTKRKRAVTEENDDVETESHKATKEPAPASKKPRGRPRKSDQAQSGAVNDALDIANKPRGRPRKSDATVDEKEEAAPQRSSGKLMRPGRQRGGKLKQSADDETMDAAMPARTTPQLSASPESSFESKPPTKILLSKSAHAEDKKSLRWLKTHGVTIEEEVPGKRVNFICVVGIGELHTTPNLLKSLALGKRVVTDQWITDSMNADRILLVEPYIHDDLADTINNDRRKLFVGKTVFFTSPLKASYGKAFTSVEVLATECGATRVDSGSATKGGEKSGAGDIIFLGMEDGDAIAQELMTDYKLPVYNKDLLIQSIIRGELLLDDEGFKLQVGKTKTPAKRGRR